VEWLVCPRETRLDLGSIIKTSFSGFRKNFVEKLITVQTPKGRTDWMLMAILRVFLWILNILNQRTAKQSTIYRPEVVLEQRKADDDKQLESEGESDQESQIVVVFVVVRGGVVMVKLGGRTLIVQSSS